jgi:ADP-ribosylglycohydrolase
MPKAFDIGTQTSSSLRNGKDGMAPLEAGRAAWGGPDHPRAGNGSLMRTAPIGVFFAHDEAERRRASLVDAGITHFDPRCRLACAAHTAAIAHAIVANHEPTPAELLEAAKRELPLAADFLRAEPDPETKSIDAGLAELTSDLDAAEADDPGLYGAAGFHIHRQQGFVRVAFRLAFWELMHVASFEQTLVDVVNRGGDSDTNGAIAGALLGACLGESAIPVRWSKVVLAALQDGPPGPWRDTYHPKVLLGLVP